MVICLPFVGQTGLFAFEGRPPVGTTLEIDMGDGLFKSGELVGQNTMRIEHETGTIKENFVFSSNSIYVGKRCSKKMRNLLASFQAFDLFSKIKGAS